MTNQEKCRALWTLIHNSPGITKEKAYIALDFSPNFGNSMNAVCPACDEAEARKIAGGRDDNMCNYCPIKGNWPDTDGNQVHNACTSKDKLSAYNRWSEITYRTDRPKSPHYTRALAIYTGYILDAIETWSEPE